MRRTRKRSRARLGLMFGVCLVVPTVAQAAPWRGVESPSAQVPAELARGALLAVRVRVASGLTPPPGSQSDRALRGFAARVCTSAPAIDAPERMCAPLIVRNVRPYDAHTLAYRLEMQVPIALADGRYDLEVRFPGGAHSVAGGVVVGRREQPPAALNVTPGELRVRAPAERAASLRVHVGARGIALAGARADYYPRYRDDGTLGTGSVAWIQIAPGTEARITALDRPPPGPPRRLPGATVEAGRALSLALPDPGVSRVFWWFSPERSAEGARALARFAAPGPTRVDAVALDGHGRSARAWVAVDVRPRVPGSCAVRGPLRPPGALLSLILVALSWKLAGGRRR